MSDKIISDNQLNHLRRFSQPQEIKLLVDSLIAARDELKKLRAASVGRCGVIGFPEQGQKICELPIGHFDYHRQGNVRWLGYTSDALRGEQCEHVCSKQTGHTGEHYLTLKLYSGPGMPEANSDERNTLRESKLQLEILLGWIDAHQTTLFRECCKCENNGDLCEFHAMLDDARKAAR